MTIQPFAGRIRLGSDWIGEGELSDVLLSKADVHIHTTYSDGLMTPAAVVEYALERRLGMPKPRALLVLGATIAAAGDLLRNPAYAGFLQRLAEQGPAALYRGQTAARIAVIESPPVLARDSGGARA